jgi:hypothetical protein
MLAVQADHVALALMDDRVDRDRGLAGRAVTDDQLALAAAERKQGVDHEDAGGERLGHQIALDDLGGRPLGGIQALRGDLRAAVEGPAQRIEHPTEKRLADGHFEDLAGRLHTAARG